MLLIEKKKNRTNPINKSIKNSYHAIESIHEKKILPYVSRKTIRIPSLPNLILLSLSWCFTRRKTSIHGFVVVTASFSHFPLFITPPPPPPAVIDIYPGSRTVYNIQWSYEYKENKRAYNVVIFLLYLFSLYRLFFYKFRYFVILRLHYCYVLFVQTTNYCLDQLVSAFAFFYVFRSCSLRDAKRVRFHVPPMFASKHLSHRSRSCPKKLKFLKRWPPTSRQIISDSRSVRALPVGIYRIW